MILLGTPPMTQINTPYPATSYLAGYLSRHGIPWRQVDFSLELALKIFSTQGLSVLVEHPSLKKSKNASARYLQKSGPFLIPHIDALVGFLQGKSGVEKVDPFQNVILSRAQIPEGPRTLAWLSQEAGNESDLDRAKVMASLILDDIAEAIRTAIDPQFGLSRYGDKLSASTPTFLPLKMALENKKLTPIERWIDEIAVEEVGRAKPNLLALTVPFPGNLYGALRIARAAKVRFPKIQVALGGGYVNTELRSLEASDIFKYVDFISYDDGEEPLRRIYHCVTQGASRDTLVRTSTLDLEEGKICPWGMEVIGETKEVEKGTPTYRDLKLDKYITVLERTNPMHRLWSEGKWNKLTLAHGCYWKKCRFCDVSLDYIKRYEPVEVAQTLKRMKAMIEETGSAQFHFVDEAAPPALLKALSHAILEDSYFQKSPKLKWWTNVRFDRAFTEDLAVLMAKAGCIALSGGLEVASDRLLALMNKGVSVDQVAKVTKGFQKAGIMVHAYLMYGFPSQTTEETIDSLERVRRLFLDGCIQSAFWHRFSATAHSPIGLDPTPFGLTIKPPKKSKNDKTFAVNDLSFEDRVKTPIEALGKGLRLAVYNYMNGQGLEEDVRVWFDLKK